MSSIKLHYDVPGDDFTRAGEASGAVKRALKDLGFSPELVRKVVIALYEAEINLVIHAGGGQIDVEITPEAIDMVLTDQGPGIPDVEMAILGPMNKHINIIEEMLGCKIIVTRDEIVCDEDYYDKIVNIIEVLKILNKKGYSIKERDIVSIIQMLQNYDLESVKTFFTKNIVFVNTYDGRQIVAKSINQKNYFDALNNNDIVFGVGAAGSGKTYLAVCYALSQLKKNKIKKIIITRPVVEAGEKLGFLPGDLKEKIDPYLIPIYDAINDIIGTEQTNKLLEKGIIEIAPLAYMRGRTLDNAIIILDEAQNTTENQMKMFLTRLGFNSKMIVTGDMTQIDLQNNIKSGLVQVLHLLKGIKDIKFIIFDKIDVMRHPLVSKIIARYEELKND